MSEALEKALAIEAPAVEIARNTQFRCTRIVEMARVTIEAADEGPADAETTRIRVCAEIIFDEAVALRDDLERIEIAFNGMRLALREEARP